MDGLATNVAAITSQIQTSAVRCGNASELVGQATGFAAEADTRTEQLTAATRSINQCIQSIKTLMDEIAVASVQQSEMISLVETGIKDISAVVQDNSDAAEKSAAVSKELSQQVRTLNSLISRSRIR